jgi:SOS response regulatory protein OraA/RecX
VPTVTALRADRRGRVAVELDGAPWRTLPADVVVRAGLAEGRALDRADLRLVRRELRRAEALVVATRALRSRDISRRRLSERLERADVAPTVLEESIGALARAGLVDDARLAHNRAESLAGRGYGDEAIRHDLGQQGVAGELVDQALEALEPEEERARRIVARRGAGGKTARYLASKGFGEDAVAATSDVGFASNGVDLPSPTALDGD